MSWICLFKVFDKKGYWKVTFEITSKCNLFCKHCCTNSDFKWSYSLEKEYIDFFLNDLKKNWISDLYITWWEPFLYPYINLFLNKVKEIWFNVSIATNAMILNDNQIKLLKSVINKSVLVSIDGYDENTHNQIRWNKLAWNKSVENIKKLTSNWVRVKISSIIWKSNIDHIEIMINNAIKWGVNEVYFVWPIKIGRLKDNKDLINDEKEYFNVFNKISALKTKYIDNINITFKRRWDWIMQSEKCLWWKKLFHINSNLEVFPCSWMAKSNNTYKSLWSINNPFLNCIQDLNNFRKIIRNRENNNNYWCPALAFIETWNINWKDPLFNNL